jgi:hypothetical protein
MATHPIEGWHRRVATGDEYTYEGEFESRGDTATWDVTIEFNGQSWHRTGSVSAMHGQMWPIARDAVANAIARVIDSLE